MNSSSYAYVGCTTANIAAHGSVNICVGGRRFLFKQRNRGHDLSRLAIAARFSHALCTARATGPEAPSIVVTDFPATELTGVTHDRMGVPSTCTVQAPHSAMPHPYFVPINLAFSRMAQSRGTSGRVSSVTLRPFSISEVGMLLPHEVTLVPICQPDKAFVAKWEFSGVKRYVVVS